MKLWYLTCFLCVSMHGAERAQAPEYWYASALKVLEPVYKRLHVPYTSPNPDSALQMLIERCEEGYGTVHEDLIQRGLCDLQSHDRYQQVLDVLKNSDKQGMHHDTRRKLVAMIHDWGVREGKQLALAPIYARCLAGDARCISSSAGWNLIRKYYEVAPYEAVGVATQVTRHMLTHHPTQPTGLSVKAMADALQSLYELCPYAGEYLARQIVSSTQHRLAFCLLSHTFAQTYRRFDGTPLASDYVQGKTYPEPAVVHYPARNVWHVTDTYPVDYNGWKLP